MGLNRETLRQGHDLARDPVSHLIPEADGLLIGQERSDRPVESATHRPDSGQLDREAACRDRLRTEGGWASEHVEDDSASGERRDLSVGNLRVITDGENRIGWWDNPSPLVDD